MATKSNIEIILSVKDNSLTAGLRKGEAALKAFNHEAGFGGGALSSMRTQVLQLAGAFAGLSAISEIGAMLKVADQNAFAFSASLKAANREFEVGSADQWEQRITSMSQKLKVYSESDIKGATARTIDMTKRLGLNADQMQRVIELSGDLSAGRTTLEGGIERVTAALRGEAEASEFLGLTLNENYVKAWYAAHDAHAKAWKDLTDLEKAQVRYNVFLEQAMPLQGKAAESINTWSGALAYVKKTVADSISGNKDLIASLTEIGTVLRDNADGIGAFASTIASAAADVIRFVAANRDVIGEVIKYGVAFTVATSVIGRLAKTWVGLNAAMTVMTGVQIIPWLRNLEIGSMAATAGVTGLRVGFVGLMGATAAYFAAYKVGEWLTMHKHMEGIAAAQKELAAGTALVSKKFKEVSASTGLTITSMEQLDAAVNEGRIHYDQLTGTWKKGSAEQQAATRQTGQVMQQATGEALAAMQKKYQEYANQIRAIQDQISGRERSLAAELRAMSRSGMSDLSAWQDQKREAEEYAKAAKDAASAANAALASGDTITAGQKYKEAIALADDSKSAYKALNTEVKSGEQTMVSQQQALRTSMEGVKASGELAIDILKQQKEAAKGAMDDLVGKSGFADLTAGMDDAEKQWLKNWQSMQSFATDQVETVRKRLDGMVGDRYVTVWVTEKVRKAAGGPILHLSGGGSPLQLASGRKLPGFGGGDKIDASLEAGEMVVNKFATRAIGLRASYAWNNQQWDVVLQELLKKLKINFGDRMGYALGGLSGVVPGPRRVGLAQGGPVGFAQGGPVTAAAGEAMTINLSFGGGSSIPVSSTRDNARKLLREFTKMNARSSQ